MQRRSKTIAGSMFERSAVLLVVSLAVLTTKSIGQAGDHAVYTTGSTLTPSTAYVDVASWGNSSVQNTPTTDICTALYNVMKTMTSGPGTLLDARGITSLTCNSTTILSPWYNSSGSGTYLTPVGLDILLPAGTITISYPWIIPTQTRVFGVGRGITTIQAVSSGYSGSKMVQLGAPTSDGNYNTLCTGNTGNDNTISFAVALSDLTLNGSNNAVNGIENCNAEEGSYVERVNIVNVNGVGLYLGTVLTTGAGTDGTSNHSGPYLDLWIVASSSSASCINIFEAQPRGIHGLTCTGTDSEPVGIYLDGSNVSLEDINVSGFTNGILIGSQSQSNATHPAVATNVLFNINGGSELTNVIHICNPSSLKGSCTSSSSGPVSDLTISALTSSSSSSNTIEDDLTDTTLANITDPEIGIYVLGESVSLGSNVGYSRFTTSPSAPTWFYGTGSSAPSGSCTTGSLFSWAGGGSGTKTLFGCANSSWGTGIK
jgi:hypothetical protein